MLRIVLAAFALIPLAFARNLPAFRWVRQLDASGVDTFAGLGVDSRGNTYIAGSTLSATFPVKAAAMAVGPDGSLYLAGAPDTGANRFRTTAGAFEITPAGPPASFPVTAVAKVDAQLSSVLAATYFGGPYDLVKSPHPRPGWRCLYWRLYGPPRAATRTPLQSGFSSTTGFMSELSGDLSTLLFSSYFGDAEHFAVQGVAAGPHRHRRRDWASRSLWHWADERLGEQPGGRAAARISNRFRGECRQPAGWFDLCWRNHRGARSRIRKRRAAIDRRCGGSGHLDRRHRDYRGGSPKVFPPAQPGSRCNPAARIPTRFWFR